ncbi:MAG: SEC-C domain-containing protein [Rhodocyclales bacterium]|nr:SEC-C domain-containing protein [Rhodocyclales bacterium]
MGKAAVAGDACPCGSGRPYARCCGRWHAGEPAPTAEALMRSRYAAYVLARHDYLLATWHASTRPPALDDAPTRWLGLEVKRHEQHGDDSAIVEFVARYRADGRGHRLHETSRFVREDGRWYYVDGDIAG